MKFDLNTQTLTWLVIGSLALNVLVLAFLALGGGRRRSKEPSGPIQMDEVLRGVLEGHAKALRQLEGAVQSLHATDRRQQGLVDATVRHVGLVRYDAFEDVGGRLSFSCALLDDHRDGVVLTSINGRQDTRVYAKPVAGGTSTYNLSTEEEDAIRQALAEPREAVEAR